ncbi:hypothetical protein GCM10020001_090190 [Nonomuraea salmonea]
MLAGVCTAHETAMTRKVIHSACGRPGSARMALQLLNPAIPISPSPSHCAKLRASTPTSGMRANPTKNTSAGMVIHLMEPPRPALRAGLAVVMTALTCR